MQELFLVVGGELVDVSGVEFRDPNNLHIVGIFTSKRTAISEWRGYAQRTVDNALMRYFVVPLTGEMQAQRNIKNATELSKHYLRNRLEPLSD